MSRNNKPREPLEDDLNSQVTFEAKDIRARQVIIWGIGLIIVLLLSQALVWWAFRFMQVSDARSQPMVSPLRVGMPPQLPPEPRLQGAPGHPMTGPQDLQSTVRLANAQLNSYGWVNEPDGIAHIPIREAMDLIVRNGLPAVPPVAAGGEAKTGKPAAAQNGAKGGTQ